MHYLASQGDIPMMTLLLEHKADVNAKDEVGERPIHYAIHADQDDAVKWLVETGKADVNAADDQGETPFLEVARLGHQEFELMAFLVSKGANAKAKTAGGESALTMALKPPFNAKSVIVSLPFLSHDCSTLFVVGGFH
jgi:ankyrin repeat protein